MKLSYDWFFFPKNYFCVFEIKLVTNQELKREFLFLQEFDFVPYKKDITIFHLTKEIGLKIIAQN